MNPCRPSLVRVEAFCHAPCVHMIKKPGLYQITMVTRCVSKIWSSWGHSGTLAFYFSHRTDRCNVGPSRPVSVGFIMFISITVGSRVDIYKWIGWKSTCIHGAKDCTHWSGEIRIVPKSCEFVGHLVFCLTWDFTTQTPLSIRHEIQVTSTKEQPVCLVWSQGNWRLSPCFFSVFKCFHGFASELSWIIFKICMKKIETGK